MQMICKRIASKSPLRGLIKEVYPEPRSIVHIVVYLSRCKTHLSSFFLLRMSKVILNIEYLEDGVVVVAACSPNEVRIEFLTLNQT